MQRLRRANRWIVAMSAALTGVLTAVAAHASVGKAPKTAGGSGTAIHRHSTTSQHSVIRHAHKHPSHPLVAPRQAPQPAPTESSGPAAVEPSQQSAPAPETAPNPTREAPPEETEPSQQSSPAPEPTQESTPTPVPAPHESAPEPAAPTPETPPVVSGGS